MTLMDYIYIYIYIYVYICFTNNKDTFRYNVDTERFTFTSYATNNDDVEQNERHQGYCRP